MSLSITATYDNKSSFTLTESAAGQSASLADSKALSSSFTYGTGDNQVTNGVSITGVLPSGGTVEFDLQTISQATFNATQNISFSGVKHFSVYNDSTTEGYDFTITATGTNAFTNIFNGGSGNLIVKPYSSFSYNDVHTGTVVSSTNKSFELNDQGSGVNYKIMVLGLD